MKKQVYELEEGLLEYTVRILKIVDQLQMQKQASKLLKKTEIIRC